MVWPAESLSPEDIRARLEWAWNSESLLSHEHAADPFLQKLLGPIQALPTTVERFLELHLARRTNRLGHTFERLIRASLETHPAVHSVVANLLIPAGEIDLLFSLKAAPHEFHALELAVKFYLFDGSMPDADQRWIGPGRRDTLFKKTRRIFSVQVPRARLTPAQDSLRARIGGAEIVTTHALVRGELFAHREAFPAAEAHLRLLPELNAELRMSEWLTAGEYSVLAADSRARPLNGRWQWICEANRLSQFPAYDDAFRENSNQAEMVLVDFGSERRRSFVTPVGWADGQLRDSM